MQSRASNHLGGYDNVFNHYDFTGKVITSRKEHTTNVQPLLTEIYAHTYDNAERVLTTTYTFNGGTPVLLSNNSYDELGRITTKLRHNNTDTLTYAYNIRNWATMLRSGGFIENLNYNANLPTGITPCYNGNIAFSTWTYNGGINKYGYTYDDLNRLTATTNYNNNNQPGGAYTENFTFDKMGNITGLGRMGSSTPLNALTLTYTGNQIKKVDDIYSSLNQYNVKEYNNRANADTEFFYDKNGNMITDLDRNIVSIRYNILNLPDTIQFSTGNQIINRYAADGRKLGTEYFTRVTNLAVPLITGQVISQSYLPGTINQNGTAYIDNKEYNTLNGIPSMTSISRVHNPEGYVSYNTSPYTGFIYDRTDHLGDIREVWHAASKTTIQRTQYYASGLPWATTPADNLTLQPYKYNGKEFVEMNGYDTYDIVWRQYYPAIMRFQTVDPYAEKYYSISPYAICGDNTVNRTDPDGRQFPIPLLEFTDILMSEKPVVTETMSRVARTTTEASSKTAETTTKTTEVSSKTTSENKTFGGRQSTESKTSKESFGKAKDANGIPRSQQPEKTIKPNTPEGKEAGLDNRNIKQWEFKNAKGERITIRQDKAAQYGEQNGEGNQSEHFNAGKSNENLSKQHHYYLW